MLLRGFKSESHIVCVLEFCFMTMNCQYDLSFLLCVLDLVVSVCVCMYMCVRVEEGKWGKCAMHICLMNT